MSVQNIMTGIEKLKMFPDGSLKLSDKVNDDMELKEDYHVAWYEINEGIVSIVRILAMKQDCINLLRRTNRAPAKLKC